jgi:GWxTD domain-containing protein
MTLAVLALGVLTASSPLPAPGEDWADTPEASFLTKEERGAWKGLATVDAREEFKRNYWRRRDPNPDTDVNEFQEEILARIKAADARFSTPDRPGSRTARGAVYVVLGPPAVVRSTSGPLETAPRQEMPGLSPLPRTALHSTGWEEWGYDRQRNAGLLKVLRRPFVEISFVVERGRDQVQKPGVFAGYREAIARSTIVRP